MSNTERCGGKNSINRRAKLLLSLIFAVLFGSFISKMILGLGVALMILMISILFFSVAKHHFKLYKELKRFLITGEVSKEFKKIEGFVKDGGIVEIDNRNYYIFVKLGLSIIPKLGMPKVVKKIVNLFDSLIGSRAEFMIKNKGNYEIYAIRGKKSVILWNFIKNIISPILLGITALFLSYITIVSIVLNVSIDIISWIILGVLLFVSGFSLITWHDDTKVILKRADAIKMNPFWNEKTFRKELASYIKYQKGLLLEWIGFTVSGGILLSLGFIYEFLPIFRTVGIHLLYITAGIAITILILSEIMAASIKIKYQEGLFKKEIAMLKTIKI